MTAFFDFFAKLLASLGVNETFYIQLAIFMVAYVLVYFIFSSAYQKAYLERKKRTVGSVDQAGALIEEAQKIEEEFSTKAREINSEIKDIYDKSRKETSAEQNDIIVKAQQSTKTYLDQARAQIDDQMGKVREQMKPHTSDVAETISKHMLGQ